MNAISTNTTASHTAQPAAQDSRLKAAAQQVVSETFLGTLMRIGREGAFKTEYGHGGRGEEIFQEQLDRVLIERAGRRFANTLTESIHKQLARESGMDRESSSRALQGAAAPAQAGVRPVTAWSQV